MNVLLLLDLRAVAAAPLQPRILASCALPGSIHSPRCTPWLPPVPKIVYARMHVGASNATRRAVRFVLLSKISSQRHIVIKDMLSTCASPLHKPHITFPSPTTRPIIITCLRHISSRYRSLSQSDIISMVYRCRGECGETASVSLVETRPNRKCRCTSQVETPNSWYDFSSDYFIISLTSLPPNSKSSPR